MSARLIARLLAILTVLAFPVVATAAPGRTSACDPCPPGCPMMAAASSAGTVASPVASKPGPAKHAPCTLDAACLWSGAAVVPSLLQTPVRVAAEIMQLRPRPELPAASRPPDRSLRPPIQL